MILRKISAAAVPLVAAVAIGAGTVGAQPTTASAPDIGYEAKLLGDKIITTLTDGKFEVVGTSVKVKDANGDTAISLPLSFRQDGLEFPLPHQVRDEGRVLELTAVKDYARARPVLFQDVASPRENLRAQDNFLSQFGIATAVGAFIGTIIGAAVGLVGFLGGAFGIATIATGAAIGGMIGTVLVGGPTLIIAGIDLISTLTAPPGTTHWQDQSAN